MTALNEVPMVVGHRGWPTRFPDNTLTGLLAAAVVADSLETDIRRSADGKLVLSHDAEICDLVVANHVWAELAELDLGGGEHPALLDEAIAAVPGTPFQFEVKNLPHQPGFEPDHRIGLETAERSRPGDIVTSFNWLTLAAVRRVFPEVATGVLVAATGDVDEAIGRCRELGHTALLPSVQLPEPDLARALSSGLQVYPWVVDGPSLAGELADLGVSGIITDDPAAIRSALERHR
jgi:glycerophosphoryl diester phosphodiesterase